LRVGSLVKKSLLQIIVLNYHNSCCQIFCGEEIAMLLLTRFNGDYVVALGEHYADVRRKYPGHVCSIEPKPDDELYHAHLEYISIRDQIHSLVKKDVS